jgi:hypothetical protein
VFHRVKLTLEADIEAQGVVGIVIVRDRPLPFLFTGSFFSRRPENDQTGSFSGQSEAGQCQSCTP